MTNEPLNEKEQLEEAILEEAHALLESEPTRAEPLEHGRFRKKKKKPLHKRIAKVLLILLVILLSIALIAAATYFILYKIGQSSMLDYDDVTVNFPQPSESIEQPSTQPLSETASTEPTTEPDRVLVYDDGKTVSYKGQTYQLNEKISTVLFIGVDRDQIEGGETHGNGGEADCVMLIAIDTETGKTKIVNISRETYAQVDIYSASGKYLESRSTQLCRAYAFGDGGELSCENTVRSVKRLLYGLPIHSYVALDMRFIGAATDAVDGITLTVLSDIIIKGNTIMREGEERTLWGENAELYVRYRNKQLLESNNLRMERQKQYIGLFMQKALQKTKGDLTTVLDLYNAMSQYMTTDLSIADVTFLLTCFLENGASFQFKGIEGTLGRMDINAVFYPDETSMYETLLDVYYTPVE